MSLAEDLKKQTKEFDQRMKKIDFQVDTLAQNSRTSGYFSPGSGTITLNYHENSPGFLNNYELPSRTSILYHEQKHRSNSDKGYKSVKINVSPQQYYKLCMADEISANIASLVYLREEYIKTQDISLFDQLGERYSFYKEALQKGTVNPLSSDPKDFEKDMSLIMNGTQKIWMDRISRSYIETHIEKTEYYSKRHKGSFKENDDVYQKQLDIAYTIGGINFKKYMHKDVEVPNRARPFVDKLADEKNRLSLKQELSTYKDNMSFGQYNNLLQHIYIADKIKEETWFKQENISKLTPKQLQEYKALVAEKIKNAKKELTQNQVSRKIQALTNEAAGSKGERFIIPSENDQNYQAALKQIYNINGIDYYSLLKINPQEKMPVEKSEYVKEIEDRNIFIRAFNKLGRWEHNLVNSLKDKCVQTWDNLFNSDKDSAAATANKSQNAAGTEKKTVKVNADEYLKKYPKWSKNKRVSEVQYAEILDLDKNVITRPDLKSKHTANANVSHKQLEPQNQPVSSILRDKPKPNNMGLSAAERLNNLSGREQQTSYTSRPRPSLEQLKSNGNGVELLLLKRRQLTK